MGTEASARRRLPSNRGAADFRSKDFRLDRRRKFFRAVAKHAYPRNTAFEVRELTKRADGTYGHGERTVYDWLDGRSEAPMSVTMRIIGAIYSE
jgi:hypothetical protein